MNTFGKALRVTTFGESHGCGIGCVIDGVPAGIYIDISFINSELEKRKGGKNIYSTQRKELDEAEILSGIFNNQTTGAPIGIFIKNKNINTQTYESIKNIFRPSHADFTYFHKYGLRDYRGGGRSSARESVARVASGAIAKIILNEFGIKIDGGILQIGDVKAKNINFKYASKSDIYSLDEDVEKEQKEEIKNAKLSNDSVGGVAMLRARNVPKGLGEPLYYKLDSAIGELMLGLNGVKAVEIGDGTECSKNYGSKNNDQMNKNGFITNHSGGVLGGVSNGEDIIVKVHFKPTSSIFMPQKTINTKNNEVILELKGRHDPCIAVRGNIVAQSMLALAIADALLLNATAKIDNLRKIYIKN